MPIPHPRDVVDASTYWSQLFEVVRPLRCWLRVAWRDGDSSDEGTWGQGLLMPVAGYLEGPDGPWPVRDVEWVDVSMRYLKGGMAGLPLRVLDDRKEEILAGLQATQLDWELRDARWSIKGFFHDEAVELVRIMNPFFGPITGRHPNDGFTTFSD